MKVKTNVKIIIGIVVILAVGFVGFQVLKLQSPAIEEARLIVKVVKPEGWSGERRITKAPSVERTSGTAAEMQQKEADIVPPEVGKTSVPETVPTAQSSDDEIKEFQAWLFSILEAEDTLEDVEQEDSNVEDDEIDYDLENSVIKSVIQEQWKNSLETYDVEGYMSAIWDDNFFYVSDMGTPDNLDDDIIFRGGQQEREGALNMFNMHDSIELDLYENGAPQFLSETHAMVDYDYKLRLASERGVFYPSGRMIFIMELRESGEWRILEWYDYPTPDP